MRENKDSKPKKASAVTLASKPESDMDRRLIIHQNIMLLPCYSKDQKRISWRFKSC